MEKAAVAELETLVAGHLDRFTLAGKQLAVTGFYRFAHRYFHSCRRLTAAAMLSS